MSDEFSIFANYKICLVDGKEFDLSGVATSCKPNKTLFIDKNGNVTLIVSDNMLKYAVMR